MKQVLWILALKRDFPISNAKQCKSFTKMNQNLAQRDVLLVLMKDIWPGPGAALHRTAKKRSVAQGAYCELFYHLHLPSRWG